MKSSIPFSLLVLGSSLAAQTTKTSVVPAAYATQEAGSLDQRPFGFDRIRFSQYIGADLMASQVPFGKTITEIAFRRDGKVYPNLTLRRSTSPTWTVRMGNYVPTVGTFPNRFLGPGTGSLNTLATVISGRKFVFPSLPPSTTGTPPFSIRLAFDSPYLNTLIGGYLVIDHYCYESRYRVHPYFVDAVRSKIDPGKALLYGSSCPAGKNRAFAVPSNPGGQNPMSLILYGAKPSSPVIATLGSSNRSAGALKLPFSLGPLGLKGCFLLASMDVLIPALSNPSGSAEMFLKVPADRGLTGSRFYLQWFGVDDRVNPNFPLAFSNGVEMTLGKSFGNRPTLNAFALYGTSLLANSKYGFLDRGICLVTRFTYR